MSALYAAEGVATKERTGVMIALPVHDGYHAWLGTLQAQLPPGSNLVPSKELHLTLLYLGDTDYIEEFKTLIYGGALDAIKWQEENLNATVTGVARFNGKDGRSPIVLLMDSPLFPEFRQRVYANIASRGVPSEQDHGFIPHITLGYIPDDADTPQIRVPRARLLFEELLVAWGDEQLRLPLSQPNKTKAVRYNSIDFSPPESVQATAKAGLAKRREFGRGGTSVGIARARDLSAGKRMSPSTIKRMVSYFARHEVDKRARGFSAGEEGYPSNGRIAWELWGGDAGKAWAEKVARQMKAADETTKEARGYGARAGETIRGNLARGNDGKFASAGSAGGASSEDEESEEKPATVRRQRLGRTAARQEEAKRQAREDKKRARAAETARRRQEAAARRAAKKRAREEAKQRELAENRKRILEQTGTPDNVIKGLEDFADGQEIEFDSDLAGELTARGLLLPTDGDGYKMSPAARSFLAAIKSGDVRKAKDALARGREIVRKRREARKRQIERMERENERNKAVGQTKPVASSDVREVVQENLSRGPNGGVVNAGNAPPVQGVPGGGTPPGRPVAQGRPSETGGQSGQSAQAAQGIRDANAASIASIATDARLDAKRRASETREAQSLVENRTRVLSQVEMPSVALDGLERFAAGQEIEYGSDVADRLISYGLIMRVNGQDAYEISPDARDFLAAVDAGDVEQAQAALVRARVAAVERGEGAHSEGLAVFKDARGRFRWILLSSNAYRDRDNEIVSLKALAQDVARADTDKDYGPLRWWHVPGADIGDCDYNALFGRFLVESGTFRNEAIGKAIFRAQAKLKASIGFRHPFNEPDTSGVYHNIRRFERSLVPAGRAANPFTSLLVRGEKMTDEERLAKLKELEALAGPDAIGSVLEAVKSAQAEADGSGVAFKGEKPSMTVTEVANAIKGEPATVTTSSASGVSDWNAVRVATKEEDGMEMEGEMEEDMEEESGEYAGDMAPGALAKVIAPMIAAAVAEAIKPLVQAMDVSTKMGEMAGVMNELKGMVGGSHAKKDDEIATLQEQQARKSAEEAAARAELQKQAESLATQLKEVQNRLDELSGEQPRAHKSERGTGYRASQASDNIAGEQHRLKESTPMGIDPNFLPFLMHQDKQAPPQA